MYRYLISPSIKTLSAPTAFICPKLTFPVTWPWSTSSVATVLHGGGCHVSHARSSSQERRQRKKKSTELRHIVGISLPSHAWGVLSRISLLWIAPHHHQRGLTFPLPQAPLHNRPERSPSGKRPVLKSWAAVTVSEMFEQVKYWEMPVVHFAHLWYTFNRFSPFHGFSPLK